MSSPVHRDEFGVEFGFGFGDRLAWLDEAVGAVRSLVDGNTVTSPEGGHYSLNEARLHPLPVRDRLPILVGGGGPEFECGQVTGTCGCRLVLSTVDTKANPDEANRV